MSSNDNSSCELYLKSKISVIEFVMIISLVMLSLLYISKINFIPANAQEEITLHAIFAEPKERWDILLDNATKILNERHPDKTIKIDYIFGRFNVKKCNKNGKKEEVLNVTSAALSIACFCYFLKKNMVLNQRGNWLETE